MTLMEALNSGETLVWGHRGAKAYAPMNTIPAFELAYEQGAQGIELDVHLSKDGVPIVLHDFTVDHTTDAEGLARDMTLAQLRELDAGSWFGDAFTGTRIPTLDEVFQAMGRRLFINVEIKSVDLVSDGVERAAADLIQRHQMQDMVIVSSFNPLVLMRFERLMPEVPRAYLYAQGMPFLARYLLFVTDSTAQHPEHVLIDERYMDWARQHNYAVNTWTVNEPDEARRLRDLSVNGIITDAPDIILKALG